MIEVFNLFHKQNRIDSIYLTKNYDQNSLTKFERLGLKLNVICVTDGTRQQYSKTNIRPGQVLKLLAVYQDLANQSTRSKRLSWPLIGRTEANRYAQCLTSTDQVYDSDQANISYLVYFDCLKKKDYCGYTR